MTIKKTYLSIALLSILSLFIFWKILLFNFFQDDYFFLYNGLYDPFVQFLNFKHPGTPLEALLFAPIFGINPFGWQLLGILIKAVTAYLCGIFTYKLTKSLLAGILSGIFFSASYAGMSTITTFNYHVPALVGIFLLLALIYGIDTIEKKQHWKRIIFFLSFGIFLDPARALPIILMFPLVVLFSSPSQKFFSMKKLFLKVIGIFFGITIIILGLWFVVFSIGYDSQLGHFIHGMQKDPTRTIVKVKTVGNYFATMGSFYTDIVYGLQLIPPKFETAIYSRPFALIGIAIFLIGGITSFLFFKTKKRFYGMVAFFIVWTYVFYLPNWLAEPRAPMSGLNHYLFLSSIGSIGLLAYLISCIKKKWIVAVISICFILLNIVKVNTILSLEAPYRSKVLIDSAMKTILQTVPGNGRNDIFVFLGPKEWFDNSVNWDVGVHFLLERKNPNPYDMPQPFYEEDIRLVMKKTCSPTSEKSVYFGTIHYPQIPLTHVYAWYMKAPGVLVDKTAQEREVLMQKGQGSNCHIIN